MEAGGHWKGEDATMKGTKTGLSVRAVLVLVIGLLFVLAVLVGCSGGSEGDTDTTKTEATEATETTEGAESEGDTETVEAGTDSSAEMEITASSPAPSVNALPMVQALSEDSEVYLTGTGFEPGQELRLMLTTEQEGLRARSDLTYGADPEPVANSQGAWVTAWGAVGRLADKGMISEGVYTVTITDTNSNPLATVPIAFYDSEKPEEEWPAWAAAAVE